MSNKKNIKTLTLGDCYLLSDLTKMPELNYMSTAQMLQTLKQNNIVPIKLRSPFDGTLVFLKEKIDNYIKSVKVT